MKNERPPLQPKTRTEELIDFVDYLLAQAIMPTDLTVRFGGNTEAQEAHYNQLKQKMALLDAKRYDQAVADGSYTPLQFGKPYDWSEEPPESAEIIDLAAHRAKKSIDTGQESHSGTA